MCPLLVFNKRPPADRPLIANRSAAFAGRGQRIAVVTVTSFELTFEIDPPEIVEGCGDGDRLAWMTRFAPPSLLSDESRAEENIIDCRA